MELSELTELRNLMAREDFTEETKKSLDNHAYKLAFDLLQSLSPRDAQQREARKALKELKKVYGDELAILQAFRRVEQLP